VFGEEFAASGREAPVHEVVGTVGEQGHSADGAGETARGLRLHGQQGEGVTVTMERLGGNGGLAASPVPGRRKSAVGRSEFAPVAAVLEVGRDAGVQDGKLFALQQMVPEGGERPPDLLAGGGVQERWVVGRP